MHRSDAPSNRRRNAANSPTQPTEASHAGFGGTEETESRTAVQDDAGSVAHTAGSAHDATGGGGAKRTRDQRSPSPELGEQTGLEQQEPAGADTGMSVSALSELVARLTENQAAAAEAARSAAAEAKAREERNAKLLQDLLAKIGGEEESATKDEGAKTRSSSARSVITAGIKAQDALLTSYVTHHISYEEMKTFEVPTDHNERIPVIAGQSLKRSGQRLNMGNYLAQDLLQENQQRVDEAYRAYIVVLHAELKDTARKKSEGLKKLLDTEYGKVEKELEDLFVTVPELKEELRTAEQAAAKATFKTEWDARCVELLSKQKHLRTRKQQKKEQKAEADLKELLDVDKNSVSTLWDKKEKLMVEKYDLQPSAAATAGDNDAGDDDIGAKLARARARAAEHQKVAAALDKQRKVHVQHKKQSASTGGKKKGDSTGGDSRRGGVKAPRTTSPSSSSKNGNQRAPPQHALGKRKGATKLRKKGGGKGEKK